MIVYIDDMNAKFGRMVMCHMIADTDDELHAMADAIGVNRKWHQKNNNHYDVSLGKKAIAVQHGAVVVTMLQMAAMNVRRKVTGELGLPDDAQIWFSEYCEQRTSNGTSNTNVRHG